MTVTDQELTLTDPDLREIFALFSSCSEYELAHTYREGDALHFERVGLDDEYELTLPKREFAFDASRAVLYYLYRHGYRLEKDGVVIGLDSSETLFV